MMTAKQIHKWIEQTASVMEENREYLTKLDSAIGDADHGNNMQRGYKAALERLPEDDSDAGAILKAVSMALISKVGGAGGPLYGTMFQQAAKALSGKEELSAEDVGRILTEAVEGVKKRGRAETGEKTMLDALVPAREAYDKAMEEGKDIPACLEASTSAAEEGMKATIEMVATKGRASYMGERSKGHQDPGATSSYLIIRTLSEVAASQ